MAACTLASLSSKNSTCDTCQRDSACLIGTHLIGRGGLALIEACHHEREDLFGGLGELHLLRHDHELLRDTCQRAIGAGDCLIRKAYLLKVVVEFELFGNAREPFGAVIAIFGNVSAGGREGAIFSR